MKQPVPSMHGKAARTWRIELAAAAHRSSDTIRTLKFPLAVDTANDQQALDRLARVVNSDSPGSLIRYVYTLLLGGFRIFGKQADTEGFRNESVFGDADWTRQVIEPSSLTAAQSFVPSQIYKRLLITPRSVNGKNSAFVPEVVAIEYAKFFCAGKHSDNIPEPERALFAAIGQAMVDAFDSWSAAVKAPLEAAGVIDATLAELGYYVPQRSLAARIASVKPCVPAGTVAFDASLQIPENATGVELHLIISRALHAAAGEVELAKKSDFTRVAQQYVTGDPNHGGLSWVFGKGLVYFRDTPVDQIMSDFDIPKDAVGAAEEVKAAAQAIPLAESSFLGGKSYSGYRMGIGGVLCSWIANYVSRLVDLDQSLQEDLPAFSLPEALLADEKILIDTGVTADEIASMISGLQADQDGARAAIKSLLGAKPACAENIERVEQYSLRLDTVSGLLSALQEKVKRAVTGAEQSGDKAAIKTVSAMVFEIPKEYKRLEAINRLRLGHRDPEQELIKAAQEFDLLHDAMHGHLKSVVSWAETTGQTLDPVKRLMAQEEGYARARGKRGRSPIEQATRTTLDMIGRAARECTRGTLEQVRNLFVLHDIFANSTDCNLYMYNRKGRLYKSNYDTSPRQPMPIKVQISNNLEPFLAAYKTWLTNFRAEVMRDNPLQLPRLLDLYRLEQSWFAWCMVGMPATIPSSLAVPEQVAEVFDLPMPIQLRLASAEISSGVLRQVFNHYYVRLCSLAAMLLKTRFYRRYRFQRAGEYDLQYVASSDPWTPPKWLITVEKPIGVALRCLAEHGAINNGKVDPQSALAILLSAQIDQEALRAYMRQAPHAWMYAWPTGAVSKLVSVGKDGVGKREIDGGAVPLVGNTAYRGVLDTMLSDKDAVSVGDIAILADQHFRQEVFRDASGKLQIKLTPECGKATLALPVKESKPDPQPLSFSRYVAIDLGERGFGYAVFDATTDALVVADKIRIRSMERLAKDELAKRRRRQAVAKFGSKFDRAEEVRRGNVVGDFCNAVNRLMAYYDAFPVFESSAGGAGGGVDKVYSEVLSRYTYSTTPTVDARRVAYWSGASLWKHSNRLQYKFDRVLGKRGTAVDALNLFPGTSVSGFASSQECACCHRNPVAIVRELVKGGQKEFEIKQGGIVELPNGSIKLHFAAQGTERLEAQRRNYRTPLTHPADEMPISGQDLVRAIARNLRQAPPSKQSRDTTVSVFHCLYLDCGNVDNADINAAKVLGARFARNAPKNTTKGA